MIVSTYAGDPVGHLCLACDAIVPEVRHDRCAACEEADVPVLTGVFEPDDHPRDPEPDAVRWRCGWGGGCTRTLERRGLCDEHRAAIQALGVLRRGRPGRVGKRSLAPRPEAIEIEPSDVLDAGDRARIPTEERAAHLARWLARVARPVRRADACRVFGLDPLHGSSKAVLALAEERRWVQRGPRGAVLPGDVSPDADA